MTAVNIGQLQWPEWMKAGVRVVRGPDWLLPTQDPKEGDLGTLIYVPKKVGDNHVSVVWDSGKERMYQSGATGKYELRAFDTAQVGIVHAGIQCTSCSMKPVRGMRWSCTECNYVELCTKCYMNDKHDIKHSFVRRETSKSEPISLSKRADQKPIQASGVFENSKVIRGPHWRYKNEDGGDSKIGDVKTVIPVKEYFGNAFVTVKWQINNHVGEYRLGAEGYVDVVALNPADGGKYYPEHLPLVGLIQLRVGDKVKVNLSLNEFKKIHEDASVWEDGMKQCLNEEGTVIDLVNQTANSHHASKADVQYRNGNRYLIMRPTLYRVAGFQKGGVVRIESNEDVLKNLQKLCGGLKFDKDILATKGKLGRVLKINQNGDIKVSVDKKCFVYSPVCCHPTNDPRDVNATPTAFDSSEEEEEEGKMWKTFAIGMGAAMVNLMKGSDRTIAIGEAIVEYAGTGKLELLKALLEKSPQQVNHKVASGGRTALQMASYEGHVEIVKLLIQHNADVNLDDNEGDTPLLYAAFGKQPDVVEILINSKGIKINSQNKKGVVPVHVAVNNADIVTLKLLVEKRCDVSIQDKAGGDTPMHDAMKQNMPGVIEMVLGSPTCNFSVKNKNGFNVLHEACMKNKVRAVDIILSKASQIVDETTPAGFTALHIAAHNDFVEIVSLLLEKGKANPDLPDMQKRTPLMLAVSKGLKRIVEVLVQGGANINKQDEDGDTALHVILQHESKENDMGVNIVYLLVEKGADINLKNKEGKSAFDLMKDPSLKEGVKRVQKYAVSPAMSQNKTPLPSHWVSMNVTGFIQVPLDPKDTEAAIRDEFSMVKKHFDKTMSNAEIISIKRVQNAMLWEHYTLYIKEFPNGEWTFQENNCLVHIPWRNNDKMVKPYPGHHKPWTSVFSRIYDKQKKEMEIKAGGAGRANEMHLYHGTKPDAVELICNSNFDFRMAGENVGARFGQGAYFAAEARYSDNYANTDDKKSKFMFVAKVLVGKTCIGNVDYKKPPYLDDEDKMKGTYNTCVNDLHHPTVYCVFDKNQYYPEYLIEYEV